MWGSAYSSTSHTTELMLQVWAMWEFVKMVSYLLWYTNQLQNTI